MCGGGRSAESGQASAEAALTFPLTVFLFLGALQLLMVAQARILTEYAAYRAVRAGSLHGGDCKAMTHAALVAVLPSMVATYDTDSLAKAFERKRDNRHEGGAPIVEVVRESPDPSAVPPAGSARFDQPGEAVRLEMRMLYWCRLRIPFANWVLHRIWLAQHALMPSPAFNPISPPARARWNGTAPLPVEGTWPGGDVGQRMVQSGRAGVYLLPIFATQTMRMMTAPRKAHFARAECAP